MKNFVGQEEEEEDEEHANLQKMGDMIRFLID